MSTEVLGTNSNLSLYDFLPTSIGQYAYTGVCRAAHGLRIVAVETFATCRYIVPAAVMWCIKRYITHDLTAYPLQVEVDKVQTQAYLNLHGSLHIEEGQKCTPVLFLHGDYSHPYTMLHLAKEAQQCSTDPVFSLYIPTIHNDQLFAAHEVLIEQAIDKIHELVTAEQGIFDGVFGVGHSKGAILLADRAFAQDSSMRIKKTCAIAGPLNVTPGDVNDSEPLKTILKKIYAAILEHPERMLIQIVPKEDWNTSYEVMAVRPGQYCYSVPGMHLSGLYSSETVEIFNDFLTHPKNIQKSLVGAVCLE